MENPATWGKAERLVHLAIRSHHNAQAAGFTGLSLVRTITDVLRDAGLLREEPVQSE